VPVDTLEPPSSAATPFSAVAASAAAQAAASSAAPEASRTQLLPTAEEPATVTVKGINRTIALTGVRAVVGRLSTCDICLSDVNVSREHAAFEREGAGWALRDLGSTNGTSVNGQKISRQRLREGDAIDIGVTELVYHEPRGNRG